MTAAKRAPRAKSAATSKAVYTAVNATLKELKLEEQDKAAASLTRRLAKAIDQETSGRTVAELGRAMLAVLESLGATPAARKAILPKGGAPLDDGGGSTKKAKLIELRGDHAGRTGSD
ncbi:terminase small subunit [Prauserella cavernicola]|uniref:Terminase small subunit actinomycetes phage-type domain-containing protein n=1 Tax=Prauserella cavernicola TaxID=2800127 RepID=A0A934V478_9PSEU|nr:hypothetical protein [Prauserella cavernicola]MBK1785127.1 hypothetical protein [Prauserella cavernicola]